MCSFSLSRSLPPSLSFSLYHQGKIHDKKLSNLSAGDLENQQQGQNKREIISHQIVGERERSVVKNRRCRGSDVLFKDVTIIIIIIIINEIYIALNLVL